MKATKFSQFLQSREELKFVDTPHWIYIVEALIWSAIIIVIGIVSNQFIAERIIYPSLNNDQYADGIFLNIAAYMAQITLWGSIILSVILFLNKLIFWASTFVFASDRRLYLKTGLMRVLVNEVSFDEIRKTDINYGWFGRFLGYGKLTMDARFVEDTDLPFIYNPEQFSKLIHHANDLDNDVNLSYVTNGMKSKADQIVPEKSKVEDQVETMQKQSEYCDKAFPKTEYQKQDGEPNPNNNPNTEEVPHDDFKSAANDSNKDIDKPAPVDVTRVDL